MDEIFIKCLKPIEKAPENFTNNVMGKVIFIE